MGVTHRYKRCAAGTVIGLFFFLFFFSSFRIVHPSSRTEPCEKFLKRETFLQGSGPLSHLQKSQASLLYAYRGRACVFGHQIVCNIMFKLQTRPWRRRKKSFDAYMPSNILHVTFQSAVFFLIFTSVFPPLLACFHPASLPSYCQRLHTQHVFVFLRTTQHLESRAARPSKTGAGASPSY